jgi:hypothetical protein
MTSTNYSINWDSLNSGGEDTGSSTNYHLRDTIGEQATGYTSSTYYTISAGYRTGDEDLTSLSLTLGTQENNTVVSYSLFDLAGKHVVVSATSSFSVGNLIDVVENVGLSQKIAIGKITDINGSVITVDRWSGDPGSLSSVPAGGDDYVYRLNGNAATLGTLSPSTGSTSLTGTRVTSNAQNGYTLSVNDDGNLRYNTSTYILNVSDGEVTAGQEEYGWKVFGANATNTDHDYPFATTTTAIQHSASTADVEERVGLIYKISISTRTPAGNYSHIVYYTITANY